MAKGFKIAFPVCALLLLVVFPFCYGFSVSCMMEYDNGGAPAVYQSPECPQWISSQNQTLDCQFSTLHGRRKYQEDRVACNLDMKIPLFGLNESNYGFQEETVSVVAVFDGHGGDEASEMASNLILNYFYQHVLFQSYKLMVKHNGKKPDDNCISLNLQQLELLKEALTNTIRDIDLKFSQEAIKNNFLSGSTANVVVIYKGLILVANVGDSKALLLSHETQPGLVDKGESTMHLSATELTNDHRPDREDEKARIEAAGGSVIVWGVPRVNGVLAMSRSIGDVYLKRYGIVAEPEFSGWRSLTPQDRFLVVASDGIFESLTTRDVSDLMCFEGNQQPKIASACSCSSTSSLAKCIVDIAYKKGSHDNLSAVVVPL